MKKHLDHLVRLDESVYFKIEPFVVEKRYDKGNIIKKPGEKDRFAHFINKGYVAKILPSEKGRDYRLRIFEPGKVAADFDSYFSDQPTDFGLKALTYTSIFELDRELEPRLLQEVPEVIPLASALNRRILKESIQWYQVFLLSRLDGYRAMKNNFQEFMHFFSDKDLAFLFKCKEYQIKKIIKQVNS
ncbi:hypothetical protein A33Q_4036 [Indibacter alkaliphilus LW1]|uniref:Cyclic nucleotide-binding domain-containing protein n=1 Tax=Indibacter alkaliphilus (strain CCUG 57479 / KCTC 22604 / LW1) TaxID=1189612 RepID=S2DQ41_INDAL|nr:hypothetical protein A33Q_4036 [Indibacter alkaliphilus LW1]